MSLEPEAAPGGGGQLMADRAYVELRDRIVTLRIPPGAPINEDALGRELDMGRTPVREAIRRLALENLVAVFPRRGTFASEINITDLAHISDVRVQLEGHASYRAAERLTARQRAELEALLAEIDALRRQGSAEALMGLDATVHRFIHRCSGNPYLEATLGRYFNLSLRIWHLVLDRVPTLGHAVHDQIQLLEAILDRNGPHARTIMHEHVLAFQREILAAFSRR